ncbi:MAG: hypothetical protein E2577_19405 [Starkeya sp.]|nr:hypothetical protein [Starkeya sp.]
MLQAIASGQPPQGLQDDIEHADAQQVQDAERWLQGQYQEYRNSLDQVDAEIKQRGAEIQAAQVQVASLQPARNAPAPSTGAPTGWMVGPQPVMGYAPSDGNGPADMGRGLY